VHGEDISDDLFALSCEPDLRFEYFQHVLSMGFDITLSTMKEIEEHKIVESCVRVAMVTKISNYMVD
jgi:hypothetical protein